MLNKTNERVEKKNLHGGIPLNRESLASLQPSRFNRGSAEGKHKTMIQLQAENTSTLPAKGLRQAVIGHLCTCHYRCPGPREPGVHVRKCRVRTHTHTHTRYLNIKPLILIANSLSYYSCFSHKHFTHVYSIRALGTSDATVKLI